MGICAKICAKMRKYAQNMCKPKNGVRLGTPNLIIHALLFEIWWYFWSEKVLIMLSTLKAFFFKFFFKIFWSFGGPKLFEVQKYSSEAYFLVGLSWIIAKCAQICWKKTEICAEICAAHIYPCYISMHTSHYSFLLFISHCFILFIFHQL
jgi:hypothetical protein